MSSLWLVRRGASDRKSPAGNMVNAGGTGNDGGYDTLAETNRRTNAMPRVVNGSYDATKRHGSTSILRGDSGLVCLDQLTTQT